MTSVKRSSWPSDDATRWAIVLVAIAVMGARRLGFQTTLSPQTAATMAFHAQTAFGKLNAEMTPTGPSGSHCSRIAWPGRSLGMVRPYNWRERPTAKSAMSIVSCTSPSDSETILPTSAVMIAPSAFLCLRNSSPMARTTWPRAGAGTSRQRLNASTLRAIAASYERSSSRRTAAIGAAVVGLVTTACDSVSAGVPPI